MPSDAPSFNSDTSRVFDTMNKMAELKTLTDSSLPHEIKAFIEQQVSSQGLEDKVNASILAEQLIQSRSRGPRAHNEILAYTAELLAGTPLDAIASQGFVAKDFVRNITDIDRGKDPKTPPTRPR